MKRLLGSGLENIFQICRSYRQNERGERHNPEFTMLEWYSTNISLEDLIIETDLIFSSILKTPPGIQISYDELFIKYTGCSAFDINFKKFQKICVNLSLAVPDSFDRNTDKDELLHFLLGMYIESKLGFDKPLFIRDFPLSQAALAKANPDGKTAARFEGYYKGIELCNGYDEIIQHNELNSRMDGINQQRIASGKMPHEKDHFFLDAVQQGIPPCVGNALGIDRLIMLALNRRTISEAMSFTVSNS